MTNNDFLGYDLDDDGLIPDGEYVATVKDCKLATTKNNGKMLILTFIVDSGQYTGYEVSATFNIHNQSKTAQQIGREGLRAVMDAIGVKDPKSESDFCNIRTYITVTSSVNNYFTPPRKENNITNYRRYEYDAAPTPTERPY